MTERNAQQIQDWNGPSGDRWAAQQEELDVSIRPFGEAALRAAQPKPGEKVLDVGCGCGDTSLVLAQAVGAGGEVTGVDVSAAMLAVARKRAAGSPNLRFEQADASSADLPQGLDLLFSRFGVMFFDDPVGAFRHMRRSLKPTGRLAFVCWQTPKANPWATVPSQAVRAALKLDPPPADPAAPGPFAFADPARVTAILSAAGFARPAAKPFEWQMKVGSTLPSAAIAASRNGPVGRLVQEAGKERLPEILAAIEKAFVPLAAPDGSVTLPANTWIVTADAG